MSTINDFEDRKQKLIAQAVAEVVRANLNLTITDFIDMFDDDEDAKTSFMETPMGQLVIAGFELEDEEESQVERSVSSEAPHEIRTPKPKRAKKGKKKAEAKAKKSAKAKAPPRPTGNGVDAIDARVMSFVAANPDCQAGAILEGAGVSRSQLRTSTKRLIDAKKIRRDGTSRAAKYSAT